MYLSHPNIVKLYGFFHDHENIYLVMECCLSGHLLQRIKQRKIFEESEILDIISNVFEAVSFLHCHGIIHRDLKP
jgi:serine/threonine protein kinase